MEWYGNDKAKDAMTKVARAKFIQNPELKDFLLSFAGTHIIEANPNDMWWAVGIGLKDKYLLHESHWDGNNWLGEILKGILQEFI